MTLLTQLDPDVIFEIANSIWVRMGYPALPQFLDVNQTYFDAETRELDFSRLEAVDIINGWIEEKTHGRIPDALDYIHPLAVMYLVNAIYFKGMWTYQFDPEDTMDAEFINQDSSRTPCHLMRLKGELSYLETDNFQAVDLPYGNGKFSMTILLPQGETTPEDLIAQVTPEIWGQWMASFQVTDLNLCLPRFKLEYGILLNDILASLGMEVAFTPAADFTRINAGGGLFINRVIHKTFVEVDEEGTEAAAVTIVELIETVIGPGMTVNRPFVFAIRENHSGALLFLGKIVDFPGE
jgi:serpin B